MVSDTPLLQEGLKRMGAELRSSVRPQRVECAGVTEDVSRGVDQLAGVGMLTQVLNEWPPRSMIDGDQEFVTSVVAKVHRYLLEWTRRNRAMM